MPAAYDHGFGLCLRHTACAFAAIALRYAAFYNGFANEVVVNLNHLKFTSCHYECQLQPLKVHIRQPRLPTQTALSSHPTTTVANSNRLEFTSDNYCCQLEPL